MSALADEVLPLIRTRTDLHHRLAANAHGAQMHTAVSLLGDAAVSEDPGIVLDVTQRTIASAVKVVMRADDSSGIIGAACRDLLALHPAAAARACPPVPRLVDWMISFQFDGDCDVFTLDPVAYAPALGERGVTAYRRRLDEHRHRLGPRPPDTERWSSAHAGDWSTLALSRQSQARRQRCQTRLGGWAICVGPGGPPAVAYG